MLATAADLQYGGARFMEASAFALLAMRRWETGQRLRARHWPAGGRAFVTIAKDLPRMTVSLTDSPSGDAIGAYLRHRDVGVRWRLLARGVLTVPQSAEHYLRGRRRQAIRTNIAHAAREGIRCVHIDAQPDKQAAAQRLADHGWTNAADAVLTRNGDDLIVALDRDEQPVGYAVATVDRRWAMLTTLYGHPSPVRWALHTELVRQLAARQVQFVFTSGENALLLPKGLQYFQRRLGYRVMNLRV